MRKLINFYDFLLRSAAGETGAGSAAPATEAGAESGGGEGNGVASTTDTTAKTLLSSAGEQAPEGDAGAPGEGGEGKAADSSQSAEPFAITQLTLPEGYTLPEEVGTAFADLINNGEMSPQERAQGLMDLYTKNAETQAAAAAEQQTAVWNDLNEKWRAESLALPEFKDNPDATAGNLKQALIAVGADNEFFKALDLTGAGNHPAVMKTLLALAKPHMEGGSVKAGGKAASTVKAADVMYPTMNKG